MGYIFKLIREFKQHNLIEAKMSEIKDLISNSTNNSELLYEWENNYDHDLKINFSIKDDSYVFELDIKELTIKKSTNNQLEFEQKITNVEEGLDIVESNIHKILDI
jgi:hypothetical protein